MQDDPGPEGTAAASPEPRSAGELVARIASVVEPGSRLVRVPLADQTALPPKTWHCVVSQMS